MNTPTTEHTEAQIDAALELHDAMTTAIRTATPADDAKGMLHFVVGWMRKVDPQFSATLKTFLEGCK